MKTVLFIILLGVLVFLAYSVAGPIKKLFTGELTTSDTSSVSSVTSDSPSSDIVSDTSSAVVPSETETLKAITMPTDTILDAAKQDAFLSEAKAKGYQAVLVELKDDSGMIYFRSSVSAINGDKAIAENAVSAETLAKKLQDAGMVPVAAVHTFKDKTAPDKTKDNTFMVKNSTYTWFDRAASDGGKPWLNPYKESARNYNLTIVEDLAKAGFKEIILKSVHFPEINSMNKAQLDTSVSISEILNQYVASAQAAAAKYHAKIAVSYNAVGYWTEKKVTYGGEAGSIKADAIAPVIRIADYGNKLTFGETVIESPQQNINAAVKAVIAQIQAKTAGQKPDIIPIIASGQNTDEIVKALAEAGINSYVVE
ncbi:MAG: hypothetical protein KHW79_06675 [Clostridiales bacterium]|nr:hypothetical protein [Clostridiales bacterium]